jgi:hypothetical protein
MMNFIVMLPDYQIVKIRENHRVTEYLQEYYSEDMISYCNERDLDYDELTAKNVEDMSTMIGATDDECKIYELDEIVRVIHETSIEQDEKEQMIKFLERLPLEQPRKCPGDLTDVIGEANELYADELLD